MGKNRVRPKGRKGAARWAKGQSSNSNPEKSKHRTAAKSRYFQHGDTGLGSATKLTAAALMRHDAVLGDESLTGMDQDETLTLKMTHKTFDTFASDWSQCSNVAFDKLLRKFQMQNAGHKEMLAVLAAVTEVTRAQGGDESETEYFAALMTTLEVTNTEETLAAVIRLLSLVIKKVPQELLVNRFSQVCEVLLRTLSVNVESENVALIRGLIGCISVVLRAQPASVWKLSEAERIFRSLLTFTAHTKPKIRKAGQHAIVAVVRGGENVGSEIHPAASIAAQHCISIITSAGPSDKAVLHMLVMLRELLPGFPKSQTKSACETILKLLTLGTNVLVSTGFAALHGLFSARPTTATLTTDLNAQLLTALYDYKPSVNDTGPIIAWLAVMQEGLLNLAQTDPGLAQAHLNRFCQSAVACWLSDRADVVKSAGLALRAVVTECMKGSKKDICIKIVETLGDGIKYQYHSAWQIVLGVLASLVEVIGGDHPDCLTALLASLANLRGSHNFPLEAEVDHVVGKAVAVMGPDKLLAAIPLNITGNEKDYEFRSSWLLPVLRDNIRNTKLAFFTNYFLPLAGRCLARSKECAANQDKVGMKTYEVLTYQIWSLLPGFCIQPVDLKESFKGLAKILGVQLGERKEIRKDILTGLRHLVTKNLEHAENRAELAKYAKNYLPILFNLYTTKPTGSEEAGQQLATLETIKVYCKITEDGLLGNLFDRALDKYIAESVDQFTRDAVVDLLRSLLLHVDKTRIEQLYKAVGQKIISKEHKEQKKAYRVLEEICRCASPAGEEFLSQCLPELQTLLVTSLSKIAQSSQAPRLRCLISILAQLKEPSKDFALTIIPEAILCIKAVNRKAREAAYLLLVAVGEAMQRWSPDSSDVVIREYMTAMLAGLVGSPTLIHCTILAICRIFFQFKDLFPNDLIEQVLENILLLLTSSTREVAGAALSFVKVFVTTTPVTVSAKFVPQIVRSLVEMTDDCQRHFRLKSKFLFERLSRKFGAEFIASLVPKSDDKTHKRLRNIRKELARRARKNSDGDANSGMEEDDDLSAAVRAGRQKTMEELLADSSDEDDDDQGEADKKTAAMAAKKKKGGKAGAGTWIQEGGEDVLDLLSTNAAQSISSTHPKAPKSQVETVKRRKDEFKIGEDGRIIITEDGDENDDRNMDKGMNRESDDSDEETFESLVSNKKRRVGTSETGTVKSGVSAMSGISAASAFSKYQTGGSGIHRKLSAPGSEYKNKKGRGDVKLKGKPDPYAYIPLSLKSLNKRKQAKMQGQFKNVVKAARKGAGVGNKKRSKDMKKVVQQMRH